MKSIVLIIAYFGSWPPWIRYFLKSCETNTSIDWLIYSDCAELEGCPDNVRIVYTDFADYVRNLELKLGLNLTGMSHYKLCDFKPTYGFVHYEEIKDYDFFGFCDLDVIFGDLRKFLGSEVLENNVISAMDDRLAGHFSLFKNSEKYRSAFMQIEGWRKQLEQHDHIGLDEGAFSRVFRRRKRASRLFFFLMKVLSSYHRKCYFVEQFSTVFAPHPWWNGSFNHPDKWYWSRGRLTNCADGDREFMYLHFMNYKSNTWYSGPDKGADPPWKDIAIVDETIKSIGDSFVIDKTGFHEPGRV